MNRFIAIDAIVIAPNRQRQEFDIEKHQELVDSIRKHGILHPPVLRLAGDSYQLVAGECRLRAMRDIIDLGDSVRYGSEDCAPGAVPFTFLGDLDELDAEEAELDENIKRSDLTWQEKARATSRLELLRSKQAARKGAPEPTLATIAKETRGSDTVGTQTAVRAEILVAKHLDRPEVAGAKSAKEALKILKTIERKEKNVELAKTVGKTLASSRHQVINGDALGWLRDQPAGVYDVILTDPPYGMGADGFGDSGGAAVADAHSYEDDYETFMRCLTALAFEGYRITKDEAHIYIFCDIDKFDTVRSELRNAGWTAFRTPLIWFKPNGQRAPWPDQGPQRKYECIAYATKGKRKVNQLKGDVLVYPTETNLGHGAQKPVDLYADLLARSANAGDKVLDPFGGTGPIIPAANTLSLYATSVELDPAHHGIAIKRLQDLSE